MKKIAVVTVDQLNLHLKPGSNPNDIVGIAHKGDRFDVLKSEEHPRATWLYVTRDDRFYWLAQSNDSGQVFARIETVADIPPTDGDIVSGFMGRWWWVLAAVAIALLAFFFVMKV